MIPTPPARRRRLSGRAAVWLAVGTLFFGGLSTTANATLVGDEVRLQVVSSVDTTFVVASGVDPDFTYSSFNWNVESSSILLFVSPVTSSNLASGVFFELSDLDWIGEPSGFLASASVADATGLFASATDSILTVGNDSIHVDLDSFAGLSLSGSPSLLISLQMQVPEPSTLLLVGIGLAALGFAGRKRGRSL